MIVVNINRSYPDVSAGNLSLEDATRGDWQGIKDQAIVEYGDVIVGVWRNHVVSAYEIEDHARLEDGRVRFEVITSQEFAGLIGQPSPVGPWKAGQARPIVYADTATIRDGDAPRIAVGNATRSVVGGYILTVDSNGQATVAPPAGGSVTVTAPLRSSEHVLTYTDDDGAAYPAAIIDRHPMGGYTFIEYIKNGAPVVEAVENGSIN